MLTSTLTVVPTVGGVSIAGSALSPGGRGGASGGDLAGCVEGAARPEGGAGGGGAPRVWDNVRPQGGGGAYSGGYSEGAGE